MHWLEENNNNNKKEADSGGKGKLGRRSWENVEVDKEGKKGVRWVIIRG